MARTTTRATTRAGSGSRPGTATSTSSANSRPGTAHQRQEKYDPNQYAREKAAKLERAKQIKADRMAAARQREHQKVMTTVFKC
jgi:hypothetical protein